MTAPHSALQIVVPIYNDWESIERLLPLVDEQLRVAGLVADVLLADDGSMSQPPKQWNAAYTHIKAVRILKLGRNLGHQRAICISLCHLRAESNCQRVLVMDGDGEDAPADIPNLVARLENDDQIRIVFAERIKRSEGPIFATFYLLYRLLHLILVGHRVRVGNFSVMRRESLESLCTASELWNNYAAASFATRQRIALVPTHRAHRLAGRSSMRFPDLVMHGLSSLSVFSDRISTRLLIGSGVAALATVSGMLMVVLIKITTGYAIPGWATNAFGLLTLLLVQIATFMLTFSFVIMFARALSTFIPMRDFHFFVLRVDEVWHASESKS
jgi:hypothetical protein